MTAFAGVKDETRFIKRAMRSKFPMCEIGELNAHELSSFVQEAQRYKMEDTTRDKLPRISKRHQG